MKTILNHNKFFGFIIIFLYLCMVVYSIKHPAKQTMSERLGIDPACAIGATAQLAQELRGSETCKQSFNAAFQWR